MDSQSFEQARKYAAQRLERELSPRLLYHGLTHTRDEVVPSATWLAGLEGVQGAALDLLLTAAWFHDVGYVEQATDHERISVRIAAQVLPGYGYAAAEVEIIGAAILATIIPQALPATLLEKIMADADLSVLGRTNFLLRNSDLRRELALFGTVFTDREWYTKQLKLIETHAYVTASACAYLNPQKTLNVAALKQRLASLTPNESLLL